MADFLGTNIALPNIDITGFISSTWIYVFIVAVIGVIIIITVALLLFFRTFNRKVVVFENISGQGYQPVLKTRARIIKLGAGGVEVLKTLAGGHYVSAYGRRMGRNAYWFAKGSDGYWYNIVLGDLDTKMAMLDLEPVDRDVRMFHTAIDRLSHATYDKRGFLEKYGPQMLLFIFLIVFILGMWFIIGKIGVATSALAQTAETNQKVLEALGGVLAKTDAINSGTIGGSGLIPVG